MFEKNHQQWKGFLFIVILIVQYCSFATGEVHFHKNANGIPSMCDDVVAKEDECTAAVGRPRQKRLIGAILFAISIFATLANLALDIYLQIKGCCGLYPSACEYRNKFNKIRDDLRKRADRMNDEYTQSENTLTFINATNQKNQDIFLELSRIMTLKYRIINTLDVHLMNKLGNFSAGIKNALAAHNRTVEKWSKTQIMTAYNGVFSSVKSAAIGLAPIVGLYGIQGILAGVKWYKKAKLAKSLATSAKQLANAPKASKLLGVKDVKSFVKTSAKVQSKSISGMSKMAKFAKVAGAIMSVVTIGFEIYAAIKKIKACEKVRDEAIRSYNQIKGEPAKFAETERNITSFQKQINQSYVEVVDQLRNETFLKYVKNATLLARGANHITAKMKTAAGNIEEFHNKINVTFDRSGIIKLQKGLVSGLRSIEYTMACFDKKISVVGHVSRECARGSNSFDILFKQANSTWSPFAAECKTSTGHTYLTRGEVVQYVDRKMKEQKLFSDCKLNSKDLRATVCFNYAENITNEKNAFDTELTVDQVKFIITGCKPAAVSPAKKKVICGQNAKLNLEQMKKKYYRFNQAEVEVAFNECPPPELVAAVVDSICLNKNKGKSLDEVKKIFSQYRADLITRKFNECVVNILPVDKKHICIFKLFQRRTLAQVQAMKAKYPASAVASVYNSFTSPAQCRAAG